MAERVVVTGMGVMSALGHSADAHLAGLRDGRAGIGPIELIDAQGLTNRIAAEVHGYRAEDHFAKNELSLRDRVTQLALVAGREAVAQAEISFEGALGDRAAVVTGCSMGGMHTLDDGYDALYRNGRSRVHPFTVPRLMANAPTSYLSMSYDIRGPSWTVSTACASSNHAIGQAFQLIRSGAVDAALAGGCEAGLTFGVLKAWEGLRVMSKDGCRPFCKTRNGMVQGEGAAIYVLESLTHAKARGAAILAEIVGYGASSDAADIVQPNQQGAERAMRSALADAGLSTAEIGYVNAHGTATAMNDRIETAAIRTVFGADADALSVSSTKSMHGHAIGAAGALEFAAVILALRDGVIAPTINYADRDPECDLNVTPNVAVERRVDAAISNSFAFGGLNAVVAARRWRGA